MFREPIPKEEYSLALGQIAYIWGMAAVMSATIRLTLTQPLADGQTRPAWDYAAELNHLGGASRLASASDRAGFGHNSDVLSGVGIFDLDSEPFVLVTPDFGDRYWVAMVSDMYGDVVGNVGTRTTGSSALPVFLVGPTWNDELPDCPKIVMRVPTRYAMVANRIYVADDGDLPTVRALQKGVDVIPLGAYLDETYEYQALPQRPLKTEGSKVPDDLAFFEALGNIITEQPPRVDEQFAVLGVLRDLYMTPEKGYAYDELDPATKVGMRRGINAGQAMIDDMVEKLDVTVNGWTVNTNTGRSGNDYVLRAALAVQSPFTNVAEEAVYFTCEEDESGEALSGANGYRLHFGSGEQPPVDAFWSISLYDGDGNLVDNPINRYAIGDRAAGLTVGDDGGVEILVQHEQPADTSNWLPAPEGEFYLQLRCYIPQEPILDGIWSPPPLKQVTIAG